MKGNDFWRIFIKWNALKLKKQFQAATLVTANVIFPNYSRSDPACGPTVTPDCKFLEKSGICTSEPMRCIYGCTLCKKPKDLLPLILPQTEIDEFRASLKKQRRPAPKPAPRKDECKDLQKTCPKWRCKNVKFKPIMAKHCKKTCGFC